MNNPPLFEELSVGVLNDTDLERILCKTQEWIDPDSTLHIYPFHEMSLTPTGYDLRAGNEWTSLRDEKRYTVADSGSVLIRSGDTVWINSLELVRMPKNKRLMGMIVSTVWNVRKGLSHVSTNVDPDWIDGKLQIVLHNHSRRDIEMPVGAYLCTLMLFKTATAATRSWRRPQGRDDTPKIVFTPPEPARRKKLIMEIGLVLFAVAVVCVAALFFYDKPFIIPITTLTLFAVALVLQHLNINNKQR